MDIETNKDLEVLNRYLYILTKFKAICNKMPDFKERWLSG